MGNTLNDDSDLEKYRNRLFAAWRVLYHASVSGNEAEEKIYADEVRKVEAEFTTFHHQRDEARDIKLCERIGFLRQWLNEDRISDSNKIVTNEQIEYWLHLNSEDKQ